jgi:hypothetical protein
MNRIDVHGLRAIRTPRIRIRQFDDPTDVNVDDEIRALFAALAR